jgi:hypothetical protein
MFGPVTTNSRRYVTSRSSGGRLRGSQAWTQDIAAGERAAIVA